VVGLIFEFGFFCGLAEWVYVKLISVEFDLLLNADLGHMCMSCDLGWIPYLYGYVDYALVMGFGEIQI
jgi:hypothetical protein